MKATISLENTKIREKIQDLVQKSKLSRSRAAALESDPLYLQFAAENVCALSDTKPEFTPGWDKPLTSLDGLYLAAIDALFVGFPAIRKAEAEIITKNQNLKFIPNPDPVPQAMFDSFCDVRTSVLRADVLDLCRDLVDPSRKPALVGFTPEDIDAVLHAVVDALWARGYHSCVPGGIKIHDNDEPVPCWQTPKEGVTRVDCYYGQCPVIAAFLSQDQDPEPYLKNAEEGL